MDILSDKKSFPDPLTCRVVRLGTNVDYNTAWLLQKKLLELRANKLIPDTLLLLEHSSVYTAGRRSAPEHLLIDQDELIKIGVSVIETDRGGQITYHGPGQIVGYPIIDLGFHNIGPKAYVRALESILSSTLQEFGLLAETIQSLTGVWVDGAKVAAIGVKISRSITMHGFALNVEPDMNFYGHIVACGITDHETTSMAQLLRQSIPLETVNKILIRHFGDFFGMQMIEIDKSELN